MLLDFFTILTRILHDDMDSALLGIGTAALLGVGDLDVLLLFSFRIMIYSVGLPKKKYIQLKYIKLYS